MAEEFFETEDIYTLTDEDGVEMTFKFLAKAEVDGAEYLALIPEQDNEAGEYVILKYEVDENGEQLLVTIDDDEEFDRIADIFEDSLFDEVDYDGEDSGK